jgi:hypothetical protein
MMIKNERKSNIQQRHATVVKNHPLQKSLKLSKKQRTAKGLPPNKYLEELYLLEINPYTGKTHPENLYKVQQELKEKQKIRYRTPGDAIDNQWIERGPNNVGGRTRMVMFDPNDVTHKRVFAGGVSGGLWVNDDITDKNSSWVQVGISDNLAVTCMAVDPNNSQIMYLGTGELYSPQQALGNGIWKSTDGGTTWANVYQIRGTTATSSYINVPGTYFMTDIIVRDKDGNPATTNDSEVFAAIGASFYSSNPVNTFVGLNDYGIFKSTDEGENWTQLTLDVDGKPVAANKFEIGTDNTLWMSTTRNIYQKGGGRVYNSTDGTNFSLKHTITNGRRTEIAVSKTNTNTLYVLGEVYTENSFGDEIAPFVSLLKTTDAFATAPTALSLPNDADTAIPAADFTRTQAYYNLVIEVDPSNDAIAYVGGIDLFRTTDSGVNWTQISKWSNNNNLGALTVPYVHADQQSFAFHPTDANIAVIGCDGGVFYASSLSAAATSDTAIIEHTKDYNTTQFYSATISQTTDPEYIVGGTQDNGVLFFNEAKSDINSATKVLRGDGTHCLIDKDGGYMIVSRIYNNIYRYNLPYTGTATAISSSDKSLNFLNAMDLDENLDILYSNGNSHLKRYTNITTSPLESSITDPLITSISAIKVSPFTTTSSKVFLGTRSGKLIKVENANTENPTITNISSSSFLGNISSIEFGASENEIMVTFYNFGVDSIWFTEDGGTTWANKEGNFPDINVRCILMNPINTNEVIIGTELGVWNTTNFRDSVPNWNHSYNGMSNVVVTSLSLRTADNTILASSYGRGLYTGKFKANNLTTWTGTIDSDWTNAGNWTNGIPATNIDVKIPETSNQPEINTAVTLGNLSIENNAALTITNSGGLTVEEDLTNEGALLINSSLSNSGSIIVEGTSTGTITYNRFVSDDWHLVSSPVIGQNYNDNWVAANAIASGTVNPNLRGIATYNNNSGGWQYMLAGQSNTFNEGQGYTTLRTSSGNLSFTGTLLTENTTEVITNGTNNAFNLIGNVFASYIPLNNGADAVHNFLDANVNALSELTIWLWNGDSYVAVNQVTTNQFIAPGQAFFVLAKPEGGTIVFNTAMQSHQNNTFFKTKQSRPEIRVFLSKGNTKKYTDIFYIDATTEGFDNGYDSSLYTGSSSNLEIYTKLVNQEKDINLAIQSIPKKYDIIIPLGIIADANEELTICIEAQNIEAGNDVYLEDKETGVFTLLNDVDDGVYKFTSATPINGSGRFFIHTTSETLHVDNDIFLSTVNVFLSDDKIQFYNLPKGKNSVELYSILGKKIVKVDLENTDFITTKNWPKTLYMVRLQTEKGTITKKILLE